MGKIPFEHIKSEPRVMLAIMNHQSPHESEDPWLQLEKERRLWSLCQMCWCVDPKERPTTVALKELLLLSQSLTQQASTLFALLLNRQPQLLPWLTKSDSKNKVPAQVRVAFDEYLNIWLEQNNYSVGIPFFLRGQLSHFYDLYTKVIRLGGSDEVSSKMNF